MLYLPVVFGTMAGVLDQLGYDASRDLSICPAFFALPAACAGEGGGFQSAAAADPS